jgi:hypothetical protein
MTKDADGGAERARKLAEEGIKAGSAGNVEKAKKLVHQAKEIDQKAVDQVVDWTDREREQDAGPRATR